MVPDRRERHELVQALLRARNRKHGGNLLENVAQTGTAFDDGSYSNPIPRGTRFPFLSQPGVTTDDKAASQSHKRIPTPHPYPFRDQVGFSYTGEAADIAKARGVPAHDQLAFNEASSTSSRLANPRTTYSQPLALNGAGLQLVYSDLWRNLFPPYCRSTDRNLTFPPLIYQDKKELTEAEKDACHEQFDHDEEQCYENHSYNPDALRGCRERAATIRDLCLRGEKEVRPWRDFDTDGVEFPKPPKGQKKRK